MEAFKEGCQPRQQQTATLNGSPVSTAPASTEHALLYSAALDWHNAWLHQEATQYSTVYHEDYAC